MSKVSLTDYRALAQFRHEIRKFLAFSEAAARALGIEPQQHQALLAVKGLPAGVEPTIGALAERLCVQHHTAVALVDADVEISEGLSGNEQIIASPGPGVVDGLVVQAMK